MPSPDILRLAGQLILSEQARRAILSSDRSLLLSQFELTSDERAAIEAARPTTVAEALATLESLAADGHSPSIPFMAGRRHPATLQTQPAT